MHPNPGSDPQLRGCFSESDSVDPGAGTPSRAQSSRNFGANVYASDIQAKEPLPARTESNSDGLKMLTIEVQMPPPLGTFPLPRTGTYWADKTAAIRPKPCPEGKLTG